MVSIGCVQGQAEGLREQLALVPISEGIPQDVLESFGVQESQEGLQDLHLAPDWEQLTPLFSGEMREFLPACLGDLDWSSRGRSLSGHLVQSLVSGFVIHLSQIHLLISKISHVCHKIHDIKEARKLKSNSLLQNYINTHLDEGRKDQISTQEPSSSSFAMEGNDDGDGLGDTYSSCSTQYHPEPSNLNNPSHHAPIPPSPNTLPSESIQEPPGDLSSSPTSRIVTLTPSLLL